MTDTLSKSPTVESEAVSDLTTDVASLTGTETGSKGDQWAVLAGMRFVLAMIVMCHHVAMIGGPRDVVHYVGRIGGLAAVIAFLFVSGYSMANSLDRDPSASRFFERRFWRIYPVYVFGLVLAVLVPLAFVLYFPDAEPKFFDSPTKTQFIEGCLMLQGIVFREMAGNGVAWSLSVEWWLYALTPLLMAQSLKTLRQIIVFSALIYVFHDLITRNGIIGGFYHDTYGLAIPCLAWAFVGGLAFYRFRDKLATLPMLILASVFLVSFYQEGSIEPLAPFTIGIAVFVIWYAETVKLTPKMRRILNWFGGVSYPLYLVHVPVMDFAHGFGCSNGALIAACCVAFAIFTYLAVDLPVQNYRRYVAKRLAQKLAASRLQHIAP